MYVYMCCLFLVSIEAREDISSCGPGLPEVVSYSVGAGNQAQVLWKGSKCFELLSHLSNPEIVFE